MGFFPPFTDDHLQRYFRIIQEGTAVRRHFDLLKWLQGEVQHYLPHEILLAAWGDFGSNNVRYDIISPATWSQNGAIAVGPAFSIAERILQSVD